jgi:hypothetical protein
MESLRSNNVLQLLEWREQIDLDPPYQRLSVWDRPKRQVFVDSILNGFDIPKLYFHEVGTTARNGDAFRYAVIDGKQRLQALWEFMSNQLALADDFVFFDDPKVQAGGLTYDQLMTEVPRLRARFDAFDVPITVVETDDENFIEELFARLNIQVPLSAAEKRNSLGGPLPFIIRQVGVSSFFREYVRIRNDRLQHFDLAAKFLYLTHADSVASTKKATLDTFVKNFRRYRDEKNPSASDRNLRLLHERTEAVLRDMEAFFGTKDPLLASSGRATLYFHIFRRFKELDEAISFTCEMLEEFNERVAAARKKSQRRGEGSDEEMTDLEQTLVLFDREKQTPNDGGAMKRQYAYLRIYFESRNLALPESLES